MVVRRLCTLFRNLYGPESAGAGRRHRNNRAQPEPAGPPRRVRSPLL